MLVFYKKFHFCHLLPFAKVGQYKQILPVHSLVDLKKMAPRLTIDLQCSEEGI